MAPTFTNIGNPPALGSTFSGTHPVPALAGVLCPLCRLPLSGAQEAADGVCAQCADAPLGFEITPEGKATVYDAAEEEMNDLAAIVQEGGAFDHDLHRTLSRRLNFCAI